MLTVGCSNFRLRIHWSFAAATAIFAVLGFGREFLILLLTVTMHEGSHIAAAALFGARTEGVSVTCMGESALIRGISSLAAWKQAVVSLAGPAINLLLFAAARLLFPDGFAVFQLCNIVVGGFNLLPSYPMDGGRVLMAVAGGGDDALRICYGVSRVVSAVVIAAGFIVNIMFPYNLSLVLLGLYMRYIARKEYMFELGRV